MDIRPAFPLLFALSFYLVFIFILRENLFNLYGLIIFCWAAVSAQLLSSGADPQILHNSRLP